MSHTGKPIFVEEGDRTLTYPTVCFSYQEEKQPHGIFYKGNTLEFIYPILMLQIILVFFVSWSIYFALRPLKQPRYVCNVLAGIVLGPSVLGRQKAFMETFFPAKEMLVFNTFAKLGTAGFIFIIAAKMDINILLKSAKKFWPISVSSYITPFAITLIFSFAMKEELSECLTDINKVIFLCGSLSVTYFPVVAQVVKELDMLTTEFGQLALSSSMVIQATSHAINTFGVFLTRGTFIFSFEYLLKLGAAILFAFFLIRPGLLLIIKRTPAEKPAQEIYVTAVVVATLVMAVITDLTWFDFLSGAFLMGLIIPDGAVIVEKSELMVMELFLPLFYVQIGYLTDVSSLKNINAIIAMLLLIFTCCLTKIIGTLLASLYLNIRFQNALLLGLILNFKGVIDLTTFHLFRSRDILDKQCYTALVLFNLLIVAIFYPLIEIFHKPQVRLAGRYSKTKSSRSLQSIHRDEEFRVLTCIYLEDNVYGMIALLQAFNHKAISPLCAYVVHVVDLVSQTAPALASYKRKGTSGELNRCISSSHIMHAFGTYSRNTGGLVSIQPFTVAAPLGTMHNIICSLAEEKNVPFIIVPFHENPVMGLNGTQKGPLRDFNTQLQLHSPCTLGIFLDKGLLFRTQKFDKFSYRIVLLFFGGTDDREALALALRMSGNPNVNITILSIHSAKDKDVKIAERQLDDLLVREFLQKSVKNHRVARHHVKIEDSLQMLDVIHSLAKKYDLIVVGKNSGPKHFKEDMMEWVQYHELGVIGDMLASTDFCDDKTSVLVIEHCKMANSCTPLYYTQ